MGFVTDSTAGTGAQGSPPATTSSWQGGRHSGHAFCVLADNASPMTLDGTNTWVIHDAGRAVVIDPGPPLPEHFARIEQVLEEAGARPDSVLLTHGHIDHSEGAGDLARRFGVGVRCIDPAFKLGDEGLDEGSHVTVGDLDLEVLATPGHTSDSLTFAFRCDGRLALLTGDTVLGRGTTVVAHPDGKLGEYLESLQRLRDLSAAESGLVDVLPGHGPTLVDATAAVSHYLAHRQDRLEQVRRALADLDDSDMAQAARAVDPMDVVRVVYADVDQVLWPAAEQSVRAQLEYLSGRASTASPDRE